MLKTTQIPENGTPSQKPLFYHHFPVHPIFSEAILTLFTNFDVPNLHPSLQPRMISAIDR
jgi:hypothetical protein